MFTLALWVVVSRCVSSDAFVPAVNTPRGGCNSYTTNRAPTMRTDTAVASSTTKAIEVPTKPIEGMKPGTSGLRKKVEVWQNEEHYLENFIQSLLDTAQSKSTSMPETIIVAGDGRYYNNEAIQIISRVLAGNGVKQIWVPSGGIMTTPAVSAAIRTRENGMCQGGIVLTASHNPGGPGEDFGIKYNLEYGQPAGEDFTDELYERSRVISSFKTVNSDDFDINAEPGTTFVVGDSVVTIIDPYKEYIDVLKSCFDFNGLRTFCQRPDFTMLFDGMHGAGGPFAERILVQELGLPEVSCFEKGKEPHHIPVH